MSLTSFYLNHAHFRNSLFVHVKQWRRSGWPLAQVTSLPISAALRNWPSADISGANSKQLQNQLTVSLKVFPTPVLNSNHTMEAALYLQCSAHISRQFKDSFCWSLWQFVPLFFVLLWLIKHNHRVIWGIYSFFYGYFFPFEVILHLSVVMWRRFVPFVDRFHFCSCFASLCSAYVYIYCTSLKTYNKFHLSLLFKTPL